MELGRVQWYSVVVRPRCSWLSYRYDVVMRERLFGLESPACGDVRHFGPTHFGLIWLTNLLLLNVEQ